MTLHFLIDILFLGNWEQLGVGMIGEQELEYELCETNGIVVLLI